MNGVAKPPRSFSQINCYRQCPHRYWLERVEKVWQRPAAWSPQGTALHYAVEMWEKGDKSGSLDDMKTWFLDSYSEEINKQTEHTPNMDFWYASGPYKGMTDVIRRRDLGLEQVQRYYEYRTDPNKPGFYDPIWSQDGEKFVEWGFEDFLGDVPVRGFVDQVEIVGEGHELRVVDVKSGKDPGGVEQLKLYQIMVRRETGMSVPKGAYWMGKNGKMVEFDLNDYPDELLIEEFTEVDQLILKEEFNATPEKKKCMFCSVSNSCQFKEI